MTEETKPERPNAKYKLSNEEAKINPDEELVFYYNRERRLEKAPESVRKLYTMEKHKFNLIRPLIADKPRAFTFFSIVILCIMIIILSIMGYFDKTYNLDGNKIEITCTRADGITIIVIKKTVHNKKNAYTGDVNIGVSPISEDTENPDYFSHRIYFTMEPQEERRFVVPFDAEKLLMVIQTEFSELKLSLKVD